MNDPSFLNSTAKTSREIAPGPLGLWLERVILALLFLFSFAAPVSIAAAQCAWALGLLFWLLRFFVFPRPRFYRTPIDYAMFAFFVLTGISSFLSYEPMVSIGKLRAAMLFTIAYLFAENVRSARTLRLLVAVLMAATAGSALFTFAQYAIGRGVKVQGVQTDSPLKAARFVTRTEIEAKPILKIDANPILDGDTIEEVDGQRIWNSEQLVNELDRPTLEKTAKLRIYRFEWNPILEIPRGKLLPGATPEERLGIGSWSRGRDRRATGFFNHWTTYSESLQLLGSLAFGLFVALPLKRSKWSLILLLVLVAISAALMLTVVRASWLSFLISGALIAVLGLRWRTLIVIAACALPLVLAGTFILHQKRNVGFFDSHDDSIRWRQTVQREGLHLLVSNPRHLLVGVGMDSIKAHWRAWGLFDNGRLPMGHMHSDYLQIALERGVPTLVAWLILMVLYARMLWRAQREVSKKKWIERGIALGALGGLAGFMISGIVHYNWGDSEVVMILYLIMGFGLVVNRFTQTQN